MEHFINFIWTASNSFSLWGDWVAHAAAHICICLPAPFSPCFVLPSPDASVICCLGRSIIQNALCFAVLHLHVWRGWLGATEFKSQCKENWSGEMGVRGGASKHTHTGAHTRTHQPQHTHITSRSLIKCPGCELCFVTSKHFHNSWAGDSNIEDIDVCPVGYTNTQVHAHTHTHTHWIFTLLSLPTSPLPQTCIFYYSLFVAYEILWPCVCVHACECSCVFMCVYVCVVLKNSFILSLTLFSLLLYLCHAP